MADPGTVTPDGRIVFCNAYVEDPSGLILVVYNPVDRHWSLPGCRVRRGESPESATARTLRSECAVGTLGMSILYEDEAGTDGFVVAFRVAIDGVPHSVRETARVAAMTAVEFLALTPYPKFYARLFAAATEARLYCVAVERKIGPDEWRLENHYAHGTSPDEAEQKFLVGEEENVSSGRLHVVACGVVIGYRVNDKKGTQLSVS